MCVTVDEILALYVDGWWFRKWNHQISQKCNDNANQFQRARARSVIKWHNTCESSVSSSSRLFARHRRLMGRWTAVRERMYEFRKFPKLSRRLASQIMCRASPSHFFFTVSILCGFTTVKERKEYDYMGNMESLERTRATRRRKYTILNDLTHVFFRVRG